MSKKQIAAVIAAILAFAGSFGTAAASLSTSSSIESKVESRFQELEKARAVTDSRYEEILRRLDEQGQDIKDLLRRVK